jgi:magnesium chelatase subunit D
MSASPRSGPQIRQGGVSAGGDPDLAAGLLRRAGVASVVIDCETGPVGLGLAGTLAARLGGICLRLGELAAGDLADTVRTWKAVA